LSSFRTSSSSGSARTTAESTGANGSACGCSTGTPPASLPDRSRAADVDGAPAVFGREDHNLPNFLRDRDRTALVDFEDSGRSDRATEWAALVEHHAARCTADADWQPFLDAVAHQARLRTARRYYACVWVALMLPGRPGHDRNPLAARRAQAERLLGLL
jgi:hypothetical protein